MAIGTVLDVEPNVYVLGMRRLICLARTSTPLLEARGVIHHNPERASEARSLGPETSQDPDSPSVSVLGLEPQRRARGRAGLTHGLLVLALAACNDGSAEGGGETGDGGSDGVDVTSGESSESTGDSTTDGETDTGDECPSDLLCGTPALCCAIGDACLQGECVPACESGIYCDEGCCAAEQVCLADMCESPGGPCEDSFDCEVDEFCEPTLNLCLPQPEGGPACTVEPRAAAFAPIEEWSWTGSPILPAYDQVLSMPLVGDLLGDETPEVVIVTHDTGDGACDTGHAYLRALDGSSGLDVWAANAEAFTDLGRVALCRTPALGDIDGDDSIDLVAHAFGGGLIAFEGDGSIKWTSTMQDGVTPYQGYFAGVAAIAIADMDADGQAEIVSGGVILDSSGRLISGLGLGELGANGLFGGNTVIADVDDDGLQEVVSGSFAHELDGSVLWSNGAADGYTAIADLDGDSLPELVVTSANFARVHDAGTGALLASFDMPGVGNGGPPTIDDFNGDGLLDFASAVGDSYTVFTFMEPATIDVLWSVPTLDVSSSRTGSSIFDFEGDGAAEVLYNDECYMRVYDGTTGEVLLEFASSSGTAAQYPIAVDVDGDNNTELVVVSDDWYQLAGITPGCPSYVGDEQLRHGVFVYGDSNDRWVRTRKIWNQHTYHITNVLADGSIPQFEPDSWGPEGFNNYRVSTPGNGVFNAADLQVDLAVSLLRACPEAVTLRATVRNEGSQGVPAGVAVEFFRGADDSGELVASAQTTNVLLPGQSEIVQVNAPLVGAPPHAFFVRVDAETPGEIEECREDNNSAAIDDVSCPNIG
ncbi:hypothetical protein [Enhygromyxa salina]|uniref:FG-GAP repeat protein n=1 Tax=Enhygromyxa salina TaxID=215803 RepID=A0A2S9Y673_9BACT|nr:hypothetical protein [Enhygromyxa salina]PRQ00594.1 FG-GAP repeat protein [Enhygromyxa salina]